MLFPKDPLESIFRNKDRKYNTVHTAALLFFLDLKQKRPVLSDRPFSLAGGGFEPPTSGL